MQWISNTLSFTNTVVGVGNATGDDGNVTAPVGPGDGPGGNVTVDPDGPIGGNITDVPIGGNITDGPGGNITDGNVTDGPSTVAPSSEGSAANTNDMVYFILEYGLMEDTVKRAPTQEEVEDLICKTNLFFRDRVRNATNDDTVQSYGMYIDWDFDGTKEQPIEVRFASNTTYYGTGIPVPVNIVSGALELTSEEIVYYIQNYVWEVEIDNSVFHNVESTNFTFEVNLPVPVGRLLTANCPETPAPSAFPTVSPAPTITAAPSSLPTTSPQPTISPAPSSSPTTSPQPTISPISPAPTLAPTDNIFDRPSSGEPGAPTVSPNATLPGGPLQAETFNFKFLASNLVGITEPAVVNASGLNVSWDVFVEGFVSQKAAEWGSSPAAAQQRLRGRRLTVVVQPDSAYISDIALADCPGNVHPESTCHDVEGTYVLLVQDENITAVRQNYSEATLIAIYDGTYQDVMEKEYPDTPLFIGSIPPPSTEAPKKSDDDDGLALWALILIILLVVLLFLSCLLCIFYYWMLKKQQAEDKQSEPYDEEGFVYDFLIPPNQKPQTEVDDEDADTKDDEEEEFEDEPGDANKAAAVDNSDPVVTIMEIDDEEFEDDEPGQTPDDAVESDETNKEEEWDEGETNKEEEWEEGEDEAARQLELAEDEHANLVPVDDEKEAPPDPEEQFGDQEDPDGVRASARDVKADPSESELEPISNEEETETEDWADEPKDEAAEPEPAAEVDAAEDFTTPEESFEEEAKEEGGGDKSFEESFEEDGDAANEEAGEEEWDGDAANEEAGEEEWDGDATNEKAGQEEWDEDSPKEEAGSGEEWDEGGEDEGGDDWDEGSGSGSSDADWDDEE
jgi:nitrogen fixation-related uncharacterized protein